MQNNLLMKCSWSFQQILLNLSKTMESEFGGGLDELVLHNWLQTMDACTTYETNMEGRLFQCFPFFNIYYNPGGHRKAASVNVTVT